MARQVYLLQSYLDNSLEGRNIARQVYLLQSYLLTPKLPR